MSVIGATASAFEEHPFIWGGVLVGLVAIIWLASRGSSTPATQQFTYTSGPSDVQTAAATALQIAQVQANAYSSSLASTQANQLAMAQIQAPLAQSYIGYLGNNSANTLTAQQDAIAAATTINGQNVGEATYTAGLQLQGLLNTNATQAAIAQTTSANQLAAVVNTNATQLNETQLVGQNQDILAGIAAQVQAGNNAAAVTINQSNNNTAWATVSSNNATALQAQTANINYNLASQNMANTTALQAQTANIYGQNLLQQTANAGQVALVGANQPYLMAQLASNQTIATTQANLSAQTQQVGYNDQVAQTQLAAVTSQIDSVYGQQPKAASSGAGGILGTIAGALGIASLL